MRFAFKGFLILDSGTFPKCRKAFKGFLILDSGTFIPQIPYGMRAAHCAWRFQYRKLSAATWATREWTGNWSPRVGILG